MLLPCFLTELGAWRRRSIDMGQGRRRSVSYDRTSTDSGLARRRGSDSSLHGSMTGSRAGSDSSMDIEMNIPPSFQLSLLDQTLQIGETAVFTVMCKFFFIKSLLNQSKCLLTCWNEIFRHLCAIYACMLATWLSDQGL